MDQMDHMNQDQRPANNLTNSRTECIEIITKDGAHKDMNF